ncbi:MAG: hypothetical protein R2718_09730 [Solirubrobacterales bacterium]
MSKRTAIMTGLAGAGIGALVGMPYLLRAGECSLLGSQSVQCAMNSSVAPFLSAIAVGFVIAMIVGNAVALAARRSMAPKAPKQRTPAAAEIEDPAIQIAAWGMPPGAGQRTVTMADPAPARVRRTGDGGPSSGRVGDGYGAAREKRAARFPARPHLRAVDPPVDAG